MYKRMCVVCVFVYIQDVRTFKIFNSFSDIQSTAKTFGHIKRQFYPTD